MVSNAVGTESKFPPRNLFFVNTVEKFKNPEYRLVSFLYLHFYIISRYGVIFGYMSGFKGRVKTDVSRWRATKYATVLPVGCLNICLNTRDSKRSQRCQVLQKY